ncbi:MAG TPA: Ig-like domain-containing protein, partial [Nitrospirota bacterium]|nr:Ig-like domain-containing protein [Nitrospirota bacterium]
MKKLTLIILALIQTAVLFTACGRMGPVPPPDKTPPGVTAVSPADGTTDFPVTGTITITFSKEMDPASIDDSTISIISDSGEFVSGSFTTTGTVTVFTPSQYLNPHTRYKMAVSTGVMDTYAIRLDHSEVFYFTTQLFPPPKVVDIRPANRAKNTALRTAISIQFSKPMDPDTIWTNNITLSNAAGNYYGDVEYNQTLNAATFYPENDLASNTGYFVTISTGVTDTSGAPMASPFVSSFQTGTSYDGTAPTVVPLVPNNKATNISVNTPIAATFSESMDPMTITPSTFIVSQGTTTIPGDIKCYGNTVVFTPANPLAYSTTYVVTIKGYSPTASSVADLAGNNMASDYSWQFTTKSQSVDTLAPSVLATWPTSTENNVSIYRPVVALFSESMLASSITPTTFVLVAQNDPNKVPVPGEIKTNGAAAIFIPSQNLSYATAYTATIISMTTPTTIMGARDLAGNPLGNGNSPAGYTWNFTTEAPASFTITASAGPRGSINPAGAVDVNVNSNPTFTVTPDAGYSIDDVKVDGVSVGAVPSYTFSGVTSDHSISASFLVTITATAGANGSISPSGAVLVSYNTSQAFTITPNAGYHINTVGGTCGGTLIGNTYTTSAVTQNCTVQPTFAANPVITVSPATNGVIAPSGSVSVTYGGSQTFTFTPNAGYHLTGVSVDGVAQTPVPASYTFTNVVANHTISATFAANPIITVTVGANGSVNPPGPTVSVTYGADQMFTFTPNTGYYVSAVLVDNVNIGAPTSYTFHNVTASHTISVAFLQGTNIITATAGAGGTLTSGGGTIVSSGTSQQFLVIYGGSLSFTISPNAGYSLTSVLVDNVAQSPVPTSYTFSNVTTPHTIVANFSINSYALTVNATGTGSGTVTGAGTYTYGTNVSVSATANAGSTFTGWSGDCSGTASPTTVLINAAKTCTATFTINGYPLTVNTAGTGSGTVTGAGTYNYGTTATVTAAANTGSTFTGWSGDCSGTASPTTVVMNAAKTCTATFTLNSYQVTSSAGSNGSITPLGNVSVNYNGTTTFTVTPNAGYT